MFEPTQYHNVTPNSAAIAHALPLRHQGYSSTTGAGHQLGGMREPAPNSPHTALLREGLRAHTDYVDSENLKIAAAQLIRLAKQASLAILCAEHLARHCHRSLIADCLTLHGLSVIHQLDLAVSQQHQLRVKLRRESTAPAYDRLI